MIVASEAMSQGSTASTILTAIRKHKLAFAAPLALALTGAVTAYVVLPRSYVAEAVVALDARKVQVLALDAVVSRLPQESPVLRSELDLIASRSMAEKVAARLGLTTSEPQEPPDSSWTQWLPDATWTQWLRGVLDGSEALAKAPGEIASEDERAALLERRNRSVVDRLIRDLRVNNDARSYTIFISVRSKDPAFAARAANAYVTAYLEHQISVQTEATRRASGWLGEKLDDLKARLEAAETAAQAFRAKTGLLEANGATFSSQRLAGMQNELNASRAQRAGAEARLAAAQQRGGDRLEVMFAEALSSQLVQALRIRRAEIAREISEIEDSGAVLSVQLPMRRQQIAAVDKQIEEEVGRLLQSLVNEVEVARRKEAALQSAAADLERKIQDVSQERVELNQLEREATASRAIYESFLNRYKQTIEQDGLATPDARLLSAAEPPERPASPKLLPLLAFALAIGGASGAGLAVLRRRGDQGLRSAAEFERLSGVTALASFTSQKGRRARTKLHPNEAQALRLCAALRLGADRDRSKIMLIVAPCARSGEDALSAILSEALTRSGLATLEIVCTNRVPVANSPAKKAGEGTQRSGREGAPVAVAGGRIRMTIPPETNADRDAWEEFKAELGRIVSRFDVVLIQTPALDISPAALRIGPLADRLLLTARLEATRRASIEEAAKLLNHCELKLDGCALAPSDGLRRLDPPEWKQIESGDGAVAEPAASESHVSARTGSAKPDLASSAGAVLRQPRHPVVAKA